MSLLRFLYRSRERLIIQTSHAIEMELDIYDVSLRPTGEEHDLVKAHHNLLLVNTDGSVHAAIKKSIVYKISVFYKISGCSDHFALKYQVTKLI